MTTPKDTQRNQTSNYNHYPNGLVIYERNGQLIAEWKNHKTEAHNETTKQQH